MILHPGVAVALRRLGSDELGIARMMAAGDLASPQRYANVDLFAMRVTGSGVAYRRAHDEFTFRDPVLYCNSEFLARCNGLPVIWEHPKGQTLTSQEFADRVIGTVFLPYVHGDEVWCIAKVWDAEAVRLMEDGDLSTSPAVVFHDPAVNSRLAMEDGSTLLIEGKPSLLDHLAVCKAGVWDKGNPPNGIRADSAGADMTEEEKLAAARKEKERQEAKDDSVKSDAAKADAKKADEAPEGGDKLDKILALLDGLNSRQDAMGARMDAMEASKADASSKKDEMSQPSKEEREVSERQSKVETEQEKERDKQGVGDSKKSDSGKKADADDKDDKKADAVRSDADYAALARDVADIKARQAREARSYTDADHLAVTKAQARADSVFNVHGKRASIPQLGETPLGYRIRMAGELKRFSPKFEKTDLARIASVDPEMFTHLEDVIYADAEIAGNNPIDLDPGELREIRKTNPDTGGVYREFKGGRTFVASMSPTPRPVTALNTRHTA